MSGGTRIMTGAVKASGSAMNIDVVGFRPKMVQIFNATGLAISVWTNSMPDASAMKTFNHADTQVAYITSNGITPRASGFTLGSDSDLNTADEVVHWVAHE